MLVETVHSTYFWTYLYIFYFHFYSNIFLSESWHHMQNIANVCYVSSFQSVKSSAVEGVHLIPNAQATNTIIM